jgi:hypothetical protein
MCAVTIASGQDQARVSASRSHYQAALDWLGSHRRRVVVALVALAVVVAGVASGVVAWQRWTHPNLFPDQGDVLVMGARPLDRATVAVPLTWTGTGPERTLTFRSASATLGTNTAAAHVTFQICERRAGHILHTGIYNLRTQCSSITPLIPGTTMTYPSHHPWAHQYLVATITPSRSGRVQLSKVTFTYSLPSHVLSRTVTDTIGTDITVPVLPNSSSR